MHGRKKNMTIRPVFAWHDFWIGAYYDRDKDRIYILPIPCIGVVIQLGCGHRWETGGMYCRTCPREGNDDAFFYDIPDEDYQHSTAVFECQKCQEIRYEDYPDCPHSEHELARRRRQNVIT